VLLWLISLERGFSLVFYSAVVTVCQKTTSLHLDEMSDSFNWRRRSSMESFDTPLGMSGNCLGGSSVYRGHNDQVAEKTRELRQE
jgi:hypothetical protein